MSGYFVIFSITFFSIIFENLIGHVLIIERIFATIFIKNYENNLKWKFTFIWIFIVVIN
ncbi:hypothetical protein Mgra_00008165 [Meloidogyne graminicola]|uniref:Uncharacterized protein n=1 Tax=Meloidogyne graminicola TaxID=189291 RepID=A0A8S9ZGV5_9BILA|nr:hypothetical protein Mgra_00008165 [Meloidogyne graminicola]